MHYLREFAIESKFDANVKSSLQTHSVSTANVIKAVKRLKTDTYNDDGIITFFSPEHTYCIHVLHNCYVLCYIKVMHPNYFTFHDDTHT